MLAADGCHRRRCLHCYCMWNNAPASVRLINAIKRLERRQSPTEAKTNAFEIGSSNDWQRSKWKLKFHFAISPIAVGYTTNDVIYKWNGARQAVAIAEDMKLSQFDLVDCPAANITDSISHSDDEGDRLATELNGMARHKSIFRCEYGRRTIWGVAKSSIDSERGWKSNTSSTSEND